MHIPKNYFHDRTILALIGANMALFLLAFLSVLLGADTTANSTSIVAYRGTERVGQISGPTSELYQFAIFVVVVTFATTMISMKLYAHRKHLSIGVLGMNMLLLIMTIIIFSALTRTL